MPGTRLSRLLTIVVSLAAALACVPPGTLAPPSSASGCTRIAAPDNLQSLIDSAGPGSVICLTPGVFRGSIMFQNKNGITLRGQGAKISIIAGGSVDSMLIFNSQNLTFENFTLYFGHPSDAYVYNSQNVIFQNVDVGGGGIGIHYDVASIGRISGSFVYAMEGDAILVRRKSNVTVERNWVFDNGGVGVSTVGETATTTVTRNIISDNRGPGVFAGQTPCSLLPPGHVEVPQCYLTDLQAFVGDANIILLSNIIQQSGSTGIVMFPGTRGTFLSNHIWNNKLTGLFVWGAGVTSQGDEFSGNEEHAIEFRAYPDPLKYGQVGTQFPVRAVGSINTDDIHDSVVLPESGKLGGGVLAQGANLDVMNSRIHNNRGIGVSFVNTSLGTIANNNVFRNGGSAICVYNAGDVMTANNTSSGNASDAPGVCLETT